MNLNKDIVTLGKLYIVENDTRSQGQVFEDCVIVRSNSPVLWVPF